MKLFHLQHQLDLVFFCAHSGWWNKRQLPACAKWLYFALMRLSPPPPTLMQFSLMWLFVSFWTFRIGGYFCTQTTYAQVPFGCAGCEIQTEGTWSKRAALLSEVEALHCEEYASYEYAVCAVWIWSRRRCFGSENFTSQPWIFIKEKYLSKFCTVLAAASRREEESQGRVNFI